jgi:phosphoesterase RecJ-like protein
MWEPVKEIIKGNANFLLTTHQNADGDGIGSAAALTELLHHLGKRVLFVADDPIPPKFNFLNHRGNQRVYDEVTDLNTFDVLIVLDAHRKERIGRLGSLSDRLITVCIDHHPIMAAEDLFATCNIIDPAACSVGAMLDTLCVEMGFPKNLPAAVGIYTSVVCDTGRFSNSTTTSQAHKIADECIKLGVDPHKVYSNLYQHLPLAQVKLFAHALQRMETHLNNRVLIEQICLEDCKEAGNQLIDLEHLDLEYIHEFNKLIEGVECVILLRELTDNHVRVSIRSTSELDISLIMRSLGGGGHSKAAGVTCEGTILDIKQKILDVLSRALLTAKSP